MTGKRTSVYLSKENWEYKEEMGISISTYVNEKLDEDRRTAGLTKRKQLERELAEVREEYNRKSRAADELADKKAELKKQLGNYEDNKEQEVEDALDALNWIVRVHPELRSEKENMSIVINKTGLRHSLLVDLCDEVDIHFCDLLSNQMDELEERGIGYDDRNSHELYDEDAGQKLTDDEREQAREFLLDNF
jgi:seryl-tRNA synthetase